MELRSIAVGAWAFVKAKLQALLILAGGLRKYELDRAREYWSFPPCKTLGKTHSSELAEKSDSIVRELIEEEILLRNQREGAEVWRDRVEAIVRDQGVRRMMDFGCGLGQDGLHFALRCGVEVIFADISPHNVKLVDRYSSIWQVPSVAVLVDDPETFEIEGKVDLILSSGVLHHSPSPGPIVENLKRHLSPGGRFVVMLYTKQHYRRSGAGSVAHYASRSEAPPPVPIENPYTDYYDPQKAAELFHGCDLVEKWTTQGGCFGWYHFVWTGGS